MALIENVRMRSKDKENSGRKRGDPDRSPVRLPLYLAPFRLLACMAIIIFLSEFSVMLIIAVLPELSIPSEALLDAMMLIVLLSPTLYILLLRPVTRHIAERRQAEEDIRHLSRQLLIAGEAERKNLARELHDEFGQAITTLRFGIEALERELPAEAVSCRARCRELTHRVQKLGEEVRDVTSSLRPDMLDDMGVVEALRWLAEEIAKQCGDLRVEFKAVGFKNRPPADIEIILYRICQEALNNVVKHAKAGRVSVLLTRSHPEVILTVRDDGIGFAPQVETSSVPRGKGIGLLGMRERIAGAGGRLDISSEKGRGTVIRAALPAEGEVDHEKN